MKQIIIKRGASRIVVLLVSAGLVLKFPVISFSGIFKTFDNWRSSIIDREFITDYFFKYSFDYPGTFSFYLFQGIVANIREYRLYRRTKNDFLWPTYLTFFGLVNIQPIGDVVCRSGSDVWDSLYVIAGEDLFADSHTFNKSDNFCHNKDGFLRILDYGAKGVSRVIDKFGCELSKINGL